MRRRSERCAPSVFVALTGRAGRHAREHPAGRVVVGGYRDELGGPAGAAGDAVPEGQRAEVDVGQQRGGDGDGSDQPGPLRLAAREAGCAEDRGDDQPGRGPAA